MAATGLLALLDDIGTMAKIAARKTAGISGDDLAVNSYALSGGGLTPERELPVVWKVAKGSLKNKFLYLIPGALALSAFAPWAITPLMMLGGAFLCYEGVEKMIHKDKHDEAKTVSKDPKVIEQEKIDSAIKTDFILSAEIVVVSLGAMAAAPFLVQLGALAAVGVAMTAGIYGLVGGIVKLDDIGLHMAEKEGDSFGAKAQRAFGKGLVKAVPYIMKGLSVLGTAAMFAVGGGILMHGIPGLEHAMTGIAHMASHSPFIVGLIETAATIAVGIGAGFAAIPAVKALEKPFARVMDKAKDLFGKVKEKLGYITRKPTNDNTPKAEPAPEAAPAALANVPSLTAAHNAVAPREAGLPPEVKKPAAPFRKFEKLISRHFGG